MKNITLAIDERILDRARAYAAERGTTVNAIVRQHLEHLTDNAERLAKAMRELREMSEQTTASLGPNYKFDREDIYADRMFPRHERTNIRGDGKK